MLQHDALLLHPHPSHRGFALPEPTPHPSCAVSTGQVDIVLAALQPSVVVAHIQGVGAPFRLPLHLPHVVSAPSPSFQKAVAALGLAGGHFPILGSHSPWCSTVVHGAVPAAVVALGVAVVHAAALALLRGWTPQHLQAVVLPLAVLLSSAFVVPAVVVGVSPWPCAPPISVLWPLSLALCRPQVGQLTAAGG